MCAHLHRKICFTGTVVDFLLVWDVTAHLDDHNFALPDESGCNLDGTVPMTVPVPITGDKVYVRTDHNAAIVNPSGGTGNVELFFDGDVPWI